MSTETNTETSTDTNTVATYSEGEVVMRMEAIERRSKSTSIRIPAELLFGCIDNDWAWNPGGREKMDCLSLVSEIQEVGIKVQPVVSCRLETIKELLALVKLWQAKKTSTTAKHVTDRLRVCQGYLRLSAIRLIKDSNIDAFNKHFASGVLVEVITGLTPEGEYYLACDHDTISRSRRAVIAQAVAMFRRGCKEGDIALQMWDEFEQTFDPIKADKKALIANAPTVASKVALMKAARHGTCQFCLTFAQTPNKTFDAYINGFTGAEGEKIARKVMTGLASAMNNSPWQKPTELFEEKWQEALKAYGVTTPAAKKRLTKGEMLSALRMTGSYGIRARILNDRGDTTIDMMDYDISLCQLESDGTIDKTIIEKLKAQVDAAITEITQAEDKKKSKSKTA